MIVNSISIFLSVAKLSSEQEWKYEQLLSILWGTKMQFLVFKKAFKDVKITWNEPRIKNQWKSLVSLEPCKYFGRPSDRQLHLIIWRGIFLHLNTQN